MATRKTVLKNLIKKFKSYLETVETGYSMYKNENNYYNIDHFYKLAQFRGAKILTLVSFIDENYKLSEEERKELMKYYWDIDNIIKDAVKEAESQGWVYYGESWKKLEKTA